MQACGAVKSLVEKCPKERIKGSILSDMKYLVSPATGFNSRVFSPEKVRYDDREETILRGGRHLFPLLPKALEGISQIGVIGWGSQGPAQAQNLRESLAGSGIKVKVGLRPSSFSLAAAEKKGFKRMDGTLGDMLDVVRESDLNLLLISDAAMAKEYKKIFASMRPQTFLGLSHGFLLGHLRNQGESFPTNIGVIAVCPKGMGPSVRRLYEQGRTINGAGINASFAVHQDINGRGTDIALGWSVALGSPFTFQTTLESEYKSDIFGERGILLGAVHGICEVLFRHFKDTNMNVEEAYLRIVEGITGPISSIISKQGIVALYQNFNEAEKDVFGRVYTAAYSPALELLLEIYEDVSSGREIGSILDCSSRLDQFPFSKIDATQLWSVAANVRTKGIHGENIPLDPTVAGLYCATMIAQCDVLMAAGHVPTEIANESVIEAVDSLNPYMKFKGVAYMVDNCSTTARLGARKWAPRFDYVFSQQTMPRLIPDAISKEEISSAISNMLNNPIHSVLKACSKLRPAVDIVPENI